MMYRSKWLAAAFLIILSGSRLASADPPACPKLPPLWRGALWLAAGQHERTVAICDEVLHRDSDNRCAYMLRGYAHLSKKNEEQQAITDFSKALRRGPDNAALHVARAQAYYDAKDYDRAIADCTAAIRIDPGYSEAFAWRARCYMKKRVTSKAIADYSLALRHAPYLARARCGRAEAYLWHNEPARAFADLEKVLRDDPDNEQARYTRCLVYLFKLRDWDRVIADSSESIQRHPREPAWYALRGLAYLVKGEEAKSLKDETTAASLKPGYFHPYFHRKAHSLSLGLSFSSNADGAETGGEDYDKRIAACTRRLTGDPNNVAAYYERAFAYAYKHEYKRTIADFDEIIRRDPVDATAFRCRAYLHIGFEAYAEALNDCAQAMRLDPGNAEDYAARAQAYSAMSKHEEALHDSTEAIRLDPRFELPYTIRGWAYECCKKFDLAILDYSKAICLAPADPDLYIRRANARSHIWDYAGVIVDYKQAVKLNPKNTQACCRLAGLLCSCPDARLRDGKEARKIATRTCEATSWRDWESLACLALACAECGDFDAAAKWEMKAGEFVPDSMKRCHEEHLQRYRAHKTYHATAPQER